MSPRSHRPLARVCDTDPHTYPEEEYADDEAEEQEATRQQVGQGVGKMSQEPVLPDQIRIGSGRVSERAAQRGPEDASDRPDERHDAKGSRLKVSLRDELRHHRPDDAHVPARQASQSSGEHGPNDRPRKAKERGADHEAEHPGEDRRFPPIPVRDSAPG